MAGKRRSGLANDRRGYRFSKFLPTVTYNGNGNTSGNAPTDSYSPYGYGSTVTVLGISGLEKSGFVFAGWNTAINGSGTSYTLGNTFEIRSNTTLYAQWIPTYTVVYDGNENTSGNVPIDGSSPYLYDSTVTVLGNSGLEKSGFIFTGWNTAENGSGASYSGEDEFAIDMNVTLYAQWTPIYTVVYDGNTNDSGNVPVDGYSPYTSGSTVTVFGNSGSPVLAKTGHTFSGWNTAANGSGTSYVQGNTFSINANRILYAQWTPVTPPPSIPTALTSVGGNTQAYILFTQTGAITNYEYSTDDGDTYLAFDPPQIYSPVNITTLSSDGTTPLTNGVTYVVRLKAVNSGGISGQSASVSVVPTTTSLLSSNRIVYLDANNSSSYSGSGTTWTNLESGGAYSAALNGTPAFNDADSQNKYFEFNPGALTGQFAQINQAAAINPVYNNPFTIQMWVRIKNVGVGGGALVSKVFFDGEGGDYDGYAFYYQSIDTLGLHQNSSQVNYYTSVTGVLSSGWALYTANIQFGNGGGRQNKIFVNGRQVLSVTNTDNIGNSTKNLTFPKGFGGEGECDIGQFYYYNTELTPTQIIQNFDATKPTYM